MAHSEMTGKTASIAFDRKGSGQSSIVFVHGLTYDRRMWEPVIEKLSNSYTCINIDLPGHGKSSDAPSYNLLAVAVSIHELVEKELHIERPVMVGHSIGAIITTIYASMYPTAGLVTSDQVLQTGEFVQRLQGLKEQLKNPAAFPQIWRSIESQLQIDLIPEERRMLVTEASNPRQQIVLGYWGMTSNELQMPPAEMAKLMIEGLRRIKCPFTAIFGEDVDAEYRAWVSAIIPQYKIVVFPNAGHFPHLVDPDRFAEEVKATAGKEV
jgi:pimeloyl-ACP methyl ester carboxylesterase